ncbi:hypothetical protein DL240_00990 [Lujinxingia litoralis]|uniref:NAD-dependent epimerase/dehydratase domain-containing protein n=1 Tax=Lujinxingia litoralis TaxID=2211119 RepID=A0A328CA47_9DELT|nr:hypothetical protein DL240_00990 [Lujinxingia litoralis]
MTGADNLVGGQVARALCEEGIGVRALVPPEAPRWHLSDLAIDWRTLRNDEGEAGWSEALHGAGALIVADTQRWSGQTGQAAEARQRSVARLRRVLDAAQRAHIPRVVVVSGEQTLADGSAEGAARLPEDFGSPQTQGLLAVESELYRYVAQGMNVCLVVAGLPLGPGDVRGDQLGLFAPDMPMHEGVLHPCDARDLAQAIVAAARKGRAGRRYPVLGKPVPLEKLTELLDAHGGCARPAASKRHWPPDWALRALPLLSDQAAGELGVRSRPLALTIRDTARWYRQAGMLRY